MAGTEAQWSGRLALGPWWAVYSGPVAETGAHRHHAVQVVLSGSEDLVAVDLPGATSDIATIVPGDLPHRIARNAERAVIVWVDADAEVGRLLAVADGSIAERLPRAIASTPPRTWAEAAELVDALAAVVGAQAPSPVHHPAVVAAMARVPQLVLLGPVQLKVVAAQVGLSEGRLSRVFAAQTGMSWRRYVRWVRLQVSARAVAGGSSLTDAAHSAGFADSAHLSRTFRAMFGVTPSLLLHVTWLQSP